jgi:polysaccharide biosynthesis transport protein
MELLYIFRILYRKKWIILAFTIFAMAVAFFLTRNQPRYFRSVAQFSTGFTEVQTLRLADETFSLQQIDVKFNNTIADMTSAKVLSLLSYRLLLHDLTDPIPFRKPDSSSADAKSVLKQMDKAEISRILTNKKDSLQVLNASIPKEKLILYLLELYQYDITAIKKTLYAGRNQRTDYIDIAFRSENPELSAYAVNTFCKEFQNYQDISRRERARESVIALDSLVKKRKQELDDKIAAKARFLTDSVSSSLDPNMVGVNVLSQISTTEASLATEEGNVQELTYQISQLDKQMTGSGTIPNTVVPTGDNSLYLSLRTQYNNLLREYQNGGSTDAAMKRQLDDLQQRMRDAAPRTNDPGTIQTNSQSGLQERRDNLEGQLRSARYKINNYRSKLNDLNAKLRSASPTASAAIDKFTKEIEVAQLEYTNTKEKLNLAASMSDGLGQNFRQTVFGQPASNPEPSKRAMVLGLAGLSAFVLTSLIFIFLAYLDQSIKTPSQFQRQTDLKLLGTVNLINMKQNNLGEQVTHIETEDAKRDNAFRELLRKLRYEIEKSGKRIILFTSTEPRQGKTTLTQALAFSLSLGKKKVLILDTNFCNNDLTAFNHAHPTLEQFSGNSHFEFKKVEPLITKTSVPYVDMIGCKGGDYTPSEILPKNHLLNYLPELLKDYDFIFMEAAPLNGFTDTKELAPYAEGVIAIFSATAEVKQADKESIKFLHELNGKFLGAVLNKVEKSDINL